MEKKNGAKSPNQRKLKALSNNTRLYAGTKINQKTETQPTGNTLFHVAEDWLKFRYEIRYNSILKVYQIQSLSDENKTWNTLNEDQLYVLMNKDNIKIGVKQILSIIKNPDFSTQYNPIKSYFEQLQHSKSYTRDYQGNSPIFHLVHNYIKTDDNGFFYDMFRKWLCRAYICATRPGYYNKQALIFISPKQSTGKTTLCRWLCPPAISECFSENLNVENKDGLISVCSNFLINLDELSQLSKFNIRKLKSVFSLDFVKERLPYDRTATKMERICSFIGSTNENEILTDETGSVRWLCFPLLSLDWGYSKNMNVDDIWREVLHLVHTEKFNYELDADETKQIESRNAQHQQMSIERELAYKYCETPNSENSGEFYTASEICSKITTYSNMKGLNNIRMGRALQANGFKRVMGTNKSYGYMINFLEPVFRPVE